jgi:hypothetical protein
MWKVFQSFSFGRHEEVGCYTLGSDHKISTPFLFNPITASPPTHSIYDLINCPTKGMNPEAGNFNVQREGTQDGIPKAGVLLLLSHKTVLELGREEDRYFSGNNGIRVLLAELLPSLSGDM